MVCCPSYGEKTSLNNAKFTTHRINFIGGKSFKKIPLAQYIYGLFKIKKIIKSFKPEKIFYLGEEAEIIGDVLDKISINTKFNGVHLVGSEHTFQIGINDAGTTLTIGVGQTLGTSNTITGANGVDDSADVLIGYISKALGNVAAGMVSLKGAQSVASNSAANLAAAAARISDTDYALETAALTKASILNQSAMAMVAQANEAQQSILTFIQ